MPTSNFTTMQICSYSPVTNTYTVLFDLNDRTTTFLITSAMPQPEKIQVRTNNIRVPGEQISRFQYKNRHVKCAMMIRGANAQALLATLRSLLAADEVPGYWLRMSPPGTSTNYSYADVRAVVHDIPYVSQVFRANAIYNVTMDFECGPTFRGDLQIIQNLCMNPGAEQPSGPGVTAFTDIMDTTNAYTVQTGGALTQGTTNYNDVVQADGPLRYFRLNETSGTTTYDAVVSGFNGTLNGGYTQSQTGPLNSDSDLATKFNG